MSRPRILALAGMVAVPAAAPAQWSDSPLQNVVVADRANDQRLPHIAATSDGGCYIGWFDHHGTGFELWLQRLDRHGVEQWPHNGVLVSDHPQTQAPTEWDLIVDGEDNCVLVFSDTRAGGDLDVYAYRIDPTGAMLWGPDGVTLSDNSGDEPRPRLCEARDGDFVFVWSDNGTSTLRLQRLDRAGSPRYAADGIGILGLPGDNPGLARVVAAENGSVILSWVRTRTLFGQRHIHAQKYDVMGDPQWNAGSPVVVFDTFSVPLDHEPILLADGLGGAAIVWHWTSGVPYDTRLQRLDAAGSERYPHNGLDVATNASSKVDPAAAIDLATQECFVLWNERSWPTGIDGVGYKAQKFDLSGNRVWGAAGRTLLATNSGRPLLNAFAFDGGLMAFAHSNDFILGMRTDADGTAVWVPPVTLSRAAVLRQRLQTAMTPSSAVLLVWDERQTTNDDILAQSVGSNGALAPPLGAVTSGGCGINPAGSLTADPPAIGTSVPFALDNPLGTQAPGSVPFLVMATAAPPAFPCGIVVPGIGMSGADGEILVDLGTVFCMLPMPTWSGVGQPSELTLDIPLDLVFVGQSLWFQGLLFDPTPGASVPIGVTNGVRWTLGY
ncbi:MAG: hypothetical protein AB7O97_14200 [Planctomycetota bacterium]